MKPVVIENPILNSPFEAPRRHFKFNDEGITNEIEEKRRPSSYFVPIASPNGARIAIVIATPETTIMFMYSANR